VLIARLRDGSDVRVLVEDGLAPEEVRDQLISNSTPTTVWVECQGKTFVRLDAVISLRIEDHSRPWVVSA
jgi:hypothetical protein